MLSNAYFLAKFRFDTAENEPAKNLQKRFAILQKKNAPARSHGHTNGAADQDAEAEHAAEVEPELQRQHRREHRTHTEQLFFHFLFMRNSDSDNARTSSYGYRQAHQNVILCIFGTEQARPNPKRTHDKNS